ncbi:MAG: disulfide reductase [Dehalococcoidia bacterium]|nr:MAG: disulfide reductase [Dehalococcoidia bacterium]
MRYYTYFPGCSAEASAVAYGLSTEAVGRALEMDLIELEDWNCCGSTPYGSLNELESICISTRNLALAEKRGLDLVTPCSACNIALNKANSYLREYAPLRRQVEESLAAADLEYRGGVRVRHLVDVLLNDVGIEDLGSKVKRSLRGLKVAPYYGCQLVRPSLGFDDPESPRSLDLLTESLGAEAVPFPLKSRCCGGSLILAEEDLALGLMGKLLANAKENGAQCLVTPCPLCQTNLDAYQRKVNSKFKTNYDLPVLFITQLIGVALGLEPKALGLGKNIVSPMKLLAPYL